MMALLLFIVYISLDFEQRFKYGGGRHAVDHPPYMWNGWLTMSAVNTYLYVLGTALAKISLLLFLYRIFRVEQKFRIAAWTIGTVLAVWSLITVLLAIFGCHPIEANWNAKLYMDPKTHCHPKVYNVVNYHGFCNIITGFALLFLPLPMLWRLQMDRKKKLGVGLVLATGALFSSRLGASKLRPPWSAQKLPGIITQDDVERGAVRSNEQHSNKRWQTPRSWHEDGTEKSSSEGFGSVSEGSEVRLQSVLPTYRELSHRDKLLK
ncbi:MAG: hypothetical protein L6R41_004650 [Letrouitia leprolyta]|nr:MAG: hypothetical protein L6R41_004650 [Letrouitia leprolyta]